MSFPSIKKVTSRVDFGGIQKQSLIDYPGKISCVLFVSGCNFSCPYCHNPQLAKGDIDPNRMIKEETAIEFLKSRRTYLDGVVISGGEPTIQNDLLSVCEIIKNMGYLVKLDTNGSQPQVIRAIIQEKLADYIAMDIKTDPFHYMSFITENDFDPKHILDSIKIIMGSAVEYEFRTTCVKPMVDKNNLKKILVHIQGAKRYVLQRVQLTNILDPGFFSNEERTYSDEQLVRLKSLSHPWVGDCILR